MSFSFKRATFITILVIISLLIIFVPFRKNYGADGLLSFIIPSPPLPPTAELLPIASDKPNIKHLLSYPLTPAKAWVLELPDIKDPVQAEKLVQTLRHKGFTAYSRQYQSLLGRLTRVFVGPEIKLDQMKQIAIRLNTEMYPLTTQVVPFDPLLTE